MAKPRQSKADILAGIERPPHSLKAAIALLCVMGIRPMATRALLRKMGEVA